MSIVEKTSGQCKCYLWCPKIQQSDWLDAGSAVLMMLELKLLGMQWWCQCYIVSQALHCWKQYLSLNPNIHVHNVIWSQMIYKSQHVHGRTLHVTSHIHMTWLNCMWPSIVALSNTCLLQVHWLQCWVHRLHYTCHRLGYLRLSQIFTTTHTHNM